MRPQDLPVLAPNVGWSYRYIQLCPGFMRVPRILVQIFTVSEPMFLVPELSPQASEESSEADADQSTDISEPLHDTWLKTCLQNLLLQCLRSSVLTLLCRSIHSKEARGAQAWGPGPRLELDSVTQQSASHCIVGEPRSSSYILQ